nr:MAG TPA: hypothetical protein [Caudoviricetes sp.]
MKWLCFFLIVVLDFIACAMMCVSTTGHGCITLYDMIPFCGISLFIATAIIAVCIYRVGMFPDCVQTLIKLSIEDC